MCEMFHMVLSQSEILWCCACTVGVFWLELWNLLAFPWNLWTINEANRWMLEVHLQVLVLYMKGWWMGGSRDRSCTVKAHFGKSVQNLVWTSLSFRDALLIAFAANPFASSSSLCLSFFAPGVCLSQFKSVCYSLQFCFICSTLPVHSSWADLQQLLVPAVPSPFFLAQFFLVILLTFLLVFLLLMYPPLLHLLIPFYLWTV